MHACAEWITALFSVPYLLSTVNRMVDDVYDYAYSSTFSLDISTCTKRPKLFVLLLVLILMFVL